MARAPWMVLLLPLATAAAADRLPAPQAGCVDTRVVTEARHIDQTTVLLKTADAGYRVDLADACPASDRDDLVAIAPAGWLCGGARDVLRVGDRVCAVESVAAINERDWAVALREQAQNGGSTTLATVNVEASVARKRRFAASSEYCVDPRRVRGWNVGSRGLVLNTAPRPGSNEATTYRVELGTSCPEADLGSQLSLRSGVGIGWVCGHPGDTAMITRDVDTPPGMAPTLNVLGAGFAARGCPIVAVYPVR